MNTIFGATFVGHWFEDALSENCSRETVRGKLLAGKCLWGNVLFASLTRHTLRLWALARPSAQPTVPYQGKGGVLSGVNKLTAANLCDKKNEQRHMSNCSYITARLTVCVNRA